MPHTRRNPRKLDLRSLAYRLEFAAEIVSEEIRFEMHPSPAVDQFLAVAGDAEEKAHHFRKSVEQGADADHLKKDLQAVIDSFFALEQLLRWEHGSFLVPRAMSRMDRVVCATTDVLKKAHPVLNRKQQIAPPVPPGQPKKSEPAQRPIPEDMKGISLLPREQQAAALAQKTCPVTGDLLGADGKPLTVRIGDRTIFVCCEDCVQQMKSNPEKFLSKRP